LTDCDTRASYLLKLVNNGAGNAMTKRYLEKRTISVAAWSATESTVRRFTTTTTIEARVRVAQIKALCLF
jgi:hypothetical protein